MKQKMSKTLKDLLYSGSVPERSQALQNKSVSLGFTNGNNADDLIPMEEAERKFKKEKRELRGI